MGKGKTVLILQARMGSTRLPGKVTKLIAGKSMLWHELSRLKRATNIDHFVVATSTKIDDDAVLSIARDAGVDTFRGDERDVLDRFYRCAKKLDAHTVVRVTGDCPLHDPQVVDEVVDRYRIQKVDYAKQPDRYPEGVDTEVFSFVALETAWKESVLPSEREHVTLFIRNHPERFLIDKWDFDGEDLSSFHWSVDTSQDFDFVTRIFDELGQTEFSKSDVIALLKRKPELLLINKGGTGFEGLEKSLREDHEWKKQHESK